MSHIWRMFCQKQNIPIYHVVLFSNRKFMYEWKYGPIPMNLKPPQLIDSLTKKTQFFVLQCILFVEQMDPNSRNAQWSSHSFCPSIFHFLSDPLPANIVEREKLAALFSKFMKRERTAKSRTHVTQIVNMPTAQALPAHHSLSRTQVIFDRCVNGRQSLIPVWQFSCKRPAEPLSISSNSLFAAELKLWVALMHIFANSH